MTYQTQFIELSQSVSALSFGEFTLKSGRISPYFFNAGKFSTGSALWKMAECYADKILESNIEFDLIFGPAYKGIPLVSAISVILSQKTGKDIPWAFNRKEAKNHGEGGTMVGSSIKGKILIVDDVITAGTAIREVITMLSKEDATITDVVVALDRQEIAPNQAQSAMQILEAEYNIKTHSVIKLDDLINYAKNSETAKPYMKNLEAYQQQYGV